MWRIKYNRCLYETLKETLKESYIRWFEHFNRENRAFVILNAFKIINKKIKIEIGAFRLSVSDLN